MEQTCNLKGWVAFTVVNAALRSKFPRSREFIPCTYCPAWSATSSSTTTTGPRRSPSRHSCRMHGGEQLCPETSDQSSDQHPMTAGQRFEQQASRCESSHSKPRIREYQKTSAERKQRSGICNSGGMSSIVTNARFVLVSEG